MHYCSRCAKDSFIHQITARDLGKNIYDPLYITCFKCGILVIRFPFPHLIMDRDIGKRIYHINSFYITKGEQCYKSKNQTCQK